MQIINKPIKELIPYEKNPRKNDEAVKYVKASIEQFGFKVPIIIDADGVIVAGHTRLKAAKELGMKEVPCIVADDLNEEQIRAFRLVDNKTGEAAEWNVELLNTELLDLEANFDMSDFGFEIYPPTGEVSDDDFDADAVADAIAEPVTKLGDIWTLGRHRLMCGDSTDRVTVGRLMDGAKADMVFTDPPYGVKYTGGIHFKDGDAVTDNREMISGDDADIYPAVFDILPQFANGACYIWFADTKAKSLYESAEAAGEIHALIIWVKNGGYGALNANYKQKHEPCLYWKPKGATLGFTGATTETTVWDINKDGVNEYHPTQKPVALASKAINNHSGADKVLDLFGGSGSTLIACEQLNRSCYMMELDPKYVQVIIERYIKLAGTDEGVSRIENDGTKTRWSDVLEVQ